MRAGAAMQVGDTESQGTIGHSLAYKQCSKLCTMVLTADALHGLAWPACRVASRVRTPAYAARVQQQWRRQLIAADLEKLEAMVEGSSSESDDDEEKEGAPQFGMFQVRAGWLQAACSALAGAAGAIYDGVPLPCFSRLLPKGH
jgi:hypothetical protein